MSEITSWVELEFAELDLGDERRQRRARKIVQDFATRPSSSIPKASNGWGETKAIYRFLENDAIEWRDIMEPHWAMTEKRMAEHPVVLCLQDTTELDFNGQKITGLGPLSYEAQRGMYLHPTYAVTPERVPLGMLDAWMWAREPLDANGKRPGQKESTRWPEGYDRVAEMAATMPGTRLVYVADREADMVELFKRSQELNTPADWLVRAKSNRNLPGGEKLWASTVDGEALGEIQFVMASRLKQKARKVHQQVWAKQVELPAGPGKTVKATCLIAREIDPPEGVEAVEWRLLTNRVATTIAEAIELIDWYRARWEIEIYFNIVKNACKVEKLQLDHIEKIERALALFMVVAWRIAFLMRMGRTCPDLNATLFFHPDEIRGAHLLTKTKKPERAPTLNEILRLIAQVGGFLGRKSDGEPGVKTIWEGLQEVRIAAMTIEAIREESQ